MREEASIKAVISQLVERREGLLILGRAALEAEWLPAALSVLARLPFDRIVTLGDAPLAAFWQRAGQRLQQLEATDETPRPDENGVIWLALADGADGGPAWLKPLLSNWLATRPSLYVGCQPTGDEEALLIHCIWEMDEVVRPYRPPGWAIATPAGWPDRKGGAISGNDRRQESTFLLLGVEIIEASPPEWLETLQTAWASAAARDGGAHTGAPVVRPYPFLDAFTENDAGRFFGRPAETRDLAELVLAERLVVCFGASGSGKSSLLQAGLMPRLRQYGCLPLYCRPEADPLHSIRAAALRQGSPGLEKHADLSDLLAALAQASGRSIVLVLDQFEEVFTLLARESAARLAEVLATCRRAPGRPLHVVFCLREDYLAYMRTLEEPHLPGLFDHRFRLRPLTLEGARAALTQPAALAGLEFEPALAETLLRDLTQDDGHVPPADLQIICDALYHDLQACGARRFTLAAYESLGGRPALLGGYLERAVAAAPQPEATRAVLKALVTARGTRVTLTAAEAAGLSGLTVEAAEAALRQLDAPLRLARQREREGRPVYELAHEVLGPRILSWINDPRERAAKEMHDLWRVELDSWRRWQTTPGPGKIQALTAERDNPFLRLTEEQVQLAARAAVQHDVEAAYWLEQATGRGTARDDLLRPALDSPQAAVRRLAVKLLGPEKARPALIRLLRADDPAARARAAATLGEFQDGQVWRALQRARHDHDEKTRRAVWESLATLRAGAARRLRRQDHLAPALSAAAVIALAGSVLYWLTPPDGNPARLWPSGVCLAAWWALRQLLPWLPMADDEDETEAAASGARRLIGPAMWLAAGGLLVAGLGWKGSLGAWLLLGWGMRGQLATALAWSLAFVPVGMGILPLTGPTILGTLAAALPALALLTLSRPAWSREAADRKAALGMLGTGTGALAGWWGARAAGWAGGWETSVLPALALALGRSWARRPLSYSGGNDVLPLLADLGRAIWDLPDQFSFHLKPGMGGWLGALWAGVLIQTAARLGPPGAAVWGGGDLGWLAVLAGVGVALGASGGLWRAAGLAGLGGALGGALAQGGSWAALNPAGAILGAGVGLGLGASEWLARRWWGA